MGPLHMLAFFKLMVLFTVLPLAVTLLRQGGCHALTRQVSILDPALEELTSTALSV